jgi:hypothetical protein
LAAGGHQRNEQIFGGYKRRVKRWRTVFPFPLGTGLEPDARKMNELDERTVSAPGDLKRLPIGVIANVPARIT